MSDFAFYNNLFYYCHPVIKMCYWMTCRYVYNPLLLRLLALLYFCYHEIHKDSPSHLLVHNTML